MKPLLQTIAWVIAIGAVTTWAALGAHRGWTRTSEPVKTIDAITGIEGIEYKPRFVPGVDLLGAALLSSALAASASLFFRKPQPKQVNV